MHTHFSALSGLQTFLAVLIVGTVWRLVAAYLAASQSPAWSRVGQIMAFQY